MQAMYKRELLQLVGILLLGWSAVTVQAEPSSTSALTSTNSPVKTNAPAAKSTWTASLAAGMTLTKGNTDTLVGSVVGEGVRKWGPNELTLGTDLAYGENSGIENTELYRGYAQYQLLFTEKFYASARVEALHDGIADISYRVILSPGVGYYFVKNTKGYLRSEIGPGYILEKRGDEVKRYVTLRLNERGQYAMTETTHGWESVELLPQVDAVDNVIVNSEVGIEVAINERWALRSCIQDSFNNVPATGKKQNDIKLITGIAFKFPK